MTTPRTPWDEMREKDKRLHLMLDHGVRPTGHGGGADYLEQYDADRLDHLHRGQDHLAPEELRRRLGPALQSGINLDEVKRVLDTSGHQHRPPSIGFPELAEVRNPERISIGSYTEGAEFVYSLLPALAARQIGVRLNGSLEVQLRAVVGEPHDPDSYLLVVPWNSDLEDWEGEPMTVPLHYPDGEYRLATVDVL